MKHTYTIITLIAICFAIPFTAADSSNAYCSYFSHSDRDAKRSGPCSFSQRQGYVDIQLKNGDSFSLEPGSKANHFMDQKKRRLTRKLNGDGTQVYQWKTHQRIEVSFDGGASGNTASSYNDEDQSDKGRSPSAVALRDMSRYCAGEAAAAFDQRPSAITTQAPIQDQGMYSIFGQYPPSGSNPSMFICTFRGDGEFVGVDRN